MSRKNGGQKNGKGKSSNAPAGGAGEDGAEASVVPSGVLHGALPAEGAAGGGDGGEGGGEGESGASSAELTGTGEGAATAVAGDGVRVAMVEVPVMETAGYARRGLERDLSRRQAEVLRDVVAALRDEGATVDGKLVKDGTDAVGWILEQIAGGSK